MILKLNYIICLFITIFILTAASCSKDSLKFPYVLVNLKLGINNDLADLGVQQSKIYSQHGLHGIIIWRNDVDEYHAFDLACTFEDDFSCAVEEDPKFEGRMVCPCCQSAYLLLLNGDPYEGPASWPLVEYNSWIEGGFLIIRN
jgi:Rieske Fe-S protein